MTGPPIGLRGYLSARLGPLALLLLIVVGMSAPIAYLAMGARTVRASAAASAVNVAEALRDEIQEQPLLWRYNTLKILTHLRAHTVHTAIERIEVTDGRGVPLDLGIDDSDLADEHLVWASAPIYTGPAQGRPTAEVWVGATLTEVEHEAFLLLLGFAALGAGLAGLTYWLPVRAMGVADRRVGGLLRRLQESQQALEALNASLEGQVRERSAQLEGALEAVREQEQRLRELSGRAIELQEAERRALSRELHDSAGQALTAIRINLQLIAQKAEDPEIRKRAEQTMSTADVTLEDIRRVVDRLGPSILDDMGLGAAVDRYCDDFAERTEIAVDREVDCPGRFESAVETGVYRMVQEALTNVSRHAGASHVRLRLVARARVLELEVEDDGRGFDIEEAAGRGRRGLTGMRERVELLGGRFALDSDLDAGTRLDVEIPIATRRDPP